MYKDELIECLDKAIKDVAGKYGCEELPPSKFTSVYYRNKENYNDFGVIDTEKVDKRVSLHYGVHLAEDERYSGWFVFEKQSKDNHEDFQLAYTEKYINGHYQQNKDKVGDEIFAEIETAINKQIEILVNVDEVKKEQVKEQPAGLKDRAAQATKVSEVQDASRDMQTRLAQERE